MHNVSCFDPKIFCLKLILWLLYDHYQGYYLQDLYFLSYDSTLQSIS